MTYLFNNPNTRKWKRLFAVSLLLNIVLVVAMVVGEFEEEDPAVKQDWQKRTDGDVQESADADLLTAEKEVVKQPEQQGRHVVHMEIEGSFYGSFSASDDVNRLINKTGIENLNDILAAQVSRILSWDLKLNKDVRKGDTLTFIFSVNTDEEMRTRDDMPEDTEIIAVSYYSNKIRRQISAYLHDESDGHGYYYGDGRRVEQDLDPLPIERYIQITEVFKGRSGGHKGIDFKVPVGVPVYSTRNGVVRRTNWHTTYNGYCIDIKVSGSPYHLKYLHLSDVLVEPGQRVKIGDHIANSGNTGRVTGPHLHYQVDRGTRPVDPYVYHKTVRRQLSGDVLNAFEDKVAGYNEIFKEAR